MVYTIPTKRGYGVELWGTYDSLSQFYEFIGKFWNDENNLTKKGFESRDKVISGFSYEIRKAKEGSRLKRKRSHFSFHVTEYFGTKISWVHFLFVLTAIRYNMRYYRTTKSDVSMILNIEFWLEKSMFSFDEIGAKKLIHFIEDGLYGANDYIYNYMRGINMDYFLHGGGKRAFRGLSELLRRGVYCTTEYAEYAKFLEKESKRLNCEISNMELIDNHIDYDNIKW